MNHYNLKATRNDLPHIYFTVYIVNNNKTLIADFFAQTYTHFHNILRHTGILSNIANNAQLLLINMVYTSNLVSSASFRYKKKAKKRAIFLKSALGTRLIQELPNKLSNDL